MSEFKVEVVRIGPVRKHPNADKLQITDVHGGYPCISQLGAFKEGDLAVYIPVDSIVPTTHPAFEFLKDSKGSPTARIKAKKLRGIFSMGLLISALDGVQEGDDVQELLGVEKYEPDESNRKPGRSGGTVMSGDAESDPGFIPKYTDIEGLRRWKNALQDGEEVVLVEKCHGSNMRAVFSQNRLWIGSRNQIKRRPHKGTKWEFRVFNFWMQAFLLQQYLETFLPDWLRILLFRRLRLPCFKVPRHPESKPSVWWTVAELYDLETRLKKARDLVVYGEVFGPVQDLKYGSTGEPMFRAFDAYDLRTGRYLDYDVFEHEMRELGIPACPVLYRGPWDIEELKHLAEGKTTISGDHVREGFVLRPIRERSMPGLGRVILKLIGEGYLLR